jgi:ABC-type Mn2+/Zn2+ transport system ATPase subunit
VFGSPELASEAASGPEVIRADRLDVAYGTRPVWQDATFTVRRGEFVAVIGPNGAGKTTLFRMLLGLQRPAGGDLRVLGTSPRRGSPRIGYVPQRHTIDNDTHIACESLVRMGVSGNRWGPGLSSARSFLPLAALLFAAYSFGTLVNGSLPAVPWLTSELARWLPNPPVTGAWHFGASLVAPLPLAGVVLLGLAVPTVLDTGVVALRFAAWTREERAAAVQALRTVGAEELAGKSLGTLSGGELQRIFLAEAMVGNPEILLLDEPLSNLDLRRSRELVDLVAGLVRSRQVTTLLVAHDINPLIQHLDKVIYIANGKVATGAPEEVLTSERLSELYEVPVEVLHDSRGNLVIVGGEESRGGEAG